MYKKILAAVNEHLNSEISARYALNLAKTCVAKLYVCFSAEKGMSGSSFEKAEEAVKRLFLDAEKMGITVEGITETGKPVEEINKIARQCLAFLPNGESRNNTPWCDRRNLTCGKSKNKKFFSGMSH